MCTELCVNFSGYTLTLYELPCCRALAAHMWPAGRIDLKVRVLVALGLLVGAKLVNVQVPFLFKDIVDGLNVTDVATVALAVPLSMLIACTCSIRARCVPFTR